eukprot:scaffold7727_cov73-Skeletonema_menzelii.AAC.5
MKRPPHYLIPSKRQHGDAVLVQFHHSTTHNITFLRSGALTPRFHKHTSSSCELLRSIVDHLPLNLVRDG